MEGSEEGDFADVTEHDYHASYYSIFEGVEHSLRPHLSLAEARQDVAQEVELRLYLRHR